ncbi:LPS ABC transporter permease [Alcanivorax sp. MD8A]|uniref:lipid A export permease/ATP-binding protein MsbA n=1 Tax=Alcanivorax sp. MD8A TaxID=1177157 RepID=UPI000C9A15E7|nr:lipid A export permease/ATP-binding protein MsbA [Alcanivorax sp. MD8A]MEE2869587.1 lipid A export permease/ATP-binding protein MsbA [Pseudomonadota bacterium]PNE02583.1 LPS ABC transporter permease [Alcanivorax sp. MD8A]
MSQSSVDVWPTYKRLLSYVRPYWFMLVLSVIGYAIYAGTQAGAAQLAGYLGETIVNPTEFRVMVVSIAPLVLVIFQGLGQFMGSYTMNWVAQQIVYVLRNDVFGHVLKLPQSEYHKNASGRIMSKIIFDAQQVTSAGTDAIIVIIREGLTVIGLFGFLLWQNWKLTLILVAVAPLIALVVNVTSKRFRKISRRIQASMSNITHFLGEAIEGSGEVKIFGGQEQEANRFHSVSRTFAKQNVKLNASKIASTVIVQLFVAVGIGAITYLYIHLMGDALTVGGFLSYIAAAGMIQKPLKQLTDVNVKVQRGVTGAASLFELLDTPEEVDQGLYVPATKVRGDIEFDGVTFGYEPKTPVIRNLSFRIRAGETVALVGRSGAGKSTISAMLPRFFDPDQGRILLDGVPLDEYTLGELRNQIAMVSQRVVLFNDTVRNNIAYGELRTADDAAIEAASRDAHAWRFIEQLEQGLDTRLGQDGVQLSGGQRQRIAIARALLKDAPVLILDEATSALDTESEHHIQQALERVMAGRTTLVIAHRLSTIEKADRILVLDQGQLMEQGSHEELLAKNGIYTQLYRMDFAEE